MKKVVFGVGTGRCGTVSLSELLNSQINANITHEDGQELLWEFSKELIDSKLEGILSRHGKYAGDIAFYYLPYVEYILEQIPDAKFLCLQREKRDVVRSYLKKTRRRNHWVHHRGIIWRKGEKWDKCFPTYGGISKKNAVGKYWDDYYEESNRLEKLHPDNFKVMNMKYALNAEEGILEVFEFLGIDVEDRILVKKIKANAL